MYRAATSPYRQLVATILVAGLLLLAAAVPAPAAEQYSEEAVKAVFLYRFTGFIDWPPASVSATEFTFAVYGDEAVADALTRLLAGRTIKDKPARVRVIARMQDLGDACVLYVGPEQREDLSAIAALAVHQSVLLVSSEEHGLERGSAINFVLVDRHVRFEVSLTAASRGGLKISSDLLSVASRVTGIGPLSWIPADNPWNRQ